MHTIVVLCDDMNVSFSISQRVLSTRCCSASRCKTRRRGAERTSRLGSLQKCRHWDKTSWTLQIQGKYRCFRSLTYINWFYHILPKTPKSSILRLWLHVFRLGEAKDKTYLQRLKRSGRNPAKKNRKNPTARKSWNLVVLVIFGFS